MPSCLPPHASFTTQQIQNPHLQPALGSPQWLYFRGLEKGLLGGVRPALPILDIDKTPVGPSSMSLSSDSWCPSSLSLVPTHPPSSPTPNTTSLRESTSTCSARPTSSTPSTPQRRQFPD
ncbi:hypothetical protein BDK51DRAFT_45812 [Blyttiomyces helicus]|uniref:Uncharacterized protein n=1 Tax=Blyttiomyces helicus TaxID=388810 RepID=A0A4P9WF27_9FUNG|nr:hypothetical protein BDK51DRAFT_45812 [Blyttiomyces helicus]|eukprot:RKO91339.1 hypothetical protein BDK51DRAFT_45812 [Blyttiomyces helicus]